VIEPGVFVSPTRVQRNADRYGSGSSCVFNVEASERWI
jgi:hypothetical protein